jgi:short-subunit dehydrogenase
MKKAIIVGATSGIGKELAIQLVNKNYLVGVTGRRENLLSDIKNKYPDNIFYKCFDVSKDNNSDKLDEFTAKLGSLDLLIISSGTGEFNPELIFEIEKNTLDVNINGFAEIACWGFNYFKKQGYGHLAGITSISGLRGS